MGAARPTEGGVYGAMKRHDVKVLREAGMSGSEVAQQAEVSLRTVRRIDREEPVSAPTEDLAKARGVGRPSKADPFRSVVEEILKEEPTATPSWISRPSVRLSPGSGLSETAKRRWPRGAPTRRPWIGSKRCRKGPE